MTLASTIRFARLVDQLSKPPRWPEKMLQRVQQTRWQQLVAHARAHSPFYQQKLAHLPPNLRSLREIPPTTKQEMRSRFADVLTDRTIDVAELQRFIADPKHLGSWFDDRYAVSHTSGSSGPPLLIVQERRCMERLFALMSSRAAPQGRPGVMEAIRRLREPKRIAVISFRRGFYPSGAAMEFMRQIVGPFVDLQHWSSLDDDLVQRLNAYRPHVIVAYASVLEALALRADELQLPHLLHIANSSERLTPQAKQRLQSVFQVPVVDHYGMGECLQLSDGCPAGGLHVNSDWAVLEVVDDQYQPVVPGVVGSRILVTNLSNRVQPFIRYEVLDRVALSATPCRCGSRLPLIQRIEGRSAELLWVGPKRQGRFISGVLFHSVTDELGGVYDWQVQQTERNAVIVRLVLSEPAGRSPGELQAIVSHRLVQQGLPGYVTTRVDVVPSLAADSSTGKVRRLIPLADTDRDET